MGPKPLGIGNLVPDVLDKKSIRNPAEIRQGPASLDETDEKLFNFVMIHAGLFATSSIAIIITNMVFFKFLLSMLMLTF